jgi:pimeloyl-ACP methyl ester carboxylesterase
MTMNDRRRFLLRFARTTLFTLCLLRLGMLGAPAAAETAETPAGTAVAAPPSPTVPGSFVRPPAPGRLVDVGGRRLHLLCKGNPAETGSPTVLFEAGLSQYTANSSFGLAQDAIAPFARVCSYDRAGLGWSDPAPAGWTQAGMVADLHALLAAAGEPRPYLLVAHSLGGLVARTYARTYPDEVVGIVLLDATSDEDFAELAAAAAVTIPQLDAAIASSRPGQPVIGLPAGTSAEVVLAFTPEVLHGVKVEFEALDRLPAEMKRPGGFGDLGALPLVVVRRGKTSSPPSEEDRKHQRVQENLVKLSRNGSMVVAENSGHTVPLDEPAVVADVVRRILDAVRNDRNERNERLAKGDGQ